MLILFHVTAAILSIILSTMSYVRPDKKKLYLSYAAAVTTLVSGTYLIVTASTNMVQSCIVGIIYFVGVTTLLFLARRKLSVAKELS